MILSTQIAKKTPGVRGLAPVRHIATQPTPEADQ